MHAAGKKSRAAMARAIVNIIFRVSQFRIRRWKSTLQPKGMPSRPELY